MCRVKAGFYRLREIIGPNGPIPVSKTTWWDGVKSGKFPQPVKLSQGITVWKSEDIEALIARISDKSRSS